MARIRTIKPEFWQDEKLAPLDPLTRLVFIGMISQADDAGRLVDSVRLLDGLLFPMTSDTCGPSLDVLADVGVIERGITSSGQPVIQIVGWSKHQKVEKPNFRGALPPIVAQPRKNIPEKVRAFIYDRDGGICQVCGIEVRIGKEDRYDKSPDLAEIDHIIPVIDGGTNDPENLRLLCLACNRKKAGEDARRRNAERSGKRRGNVGEESPPHTSYQRPATNDQLPATGARGGTPTPARDDADQAGGQAGGPELDQEDLIDSVIAACNEGMANNPRIASSFRPISLRNKRSRGAVAELLAEGIPADTIRRVVFEGARGWEPDGENTQIKFLSYFSEKVRKQHRSAGNGAGAAPVRRPPTVDELRKKEKQADEVYETWKARVLSRLQEEPDAVRADLEKDAQKLLGDSLNAFKGTPRTRMIEATMAEIFGARIGDVKPDSVRNIA